MKSLFKAVLVTGLIGVGVGMWFGVNIGKGHEFYGNPFAGAAACTPDGEVAQDLIEKGADMLHESKEALKEKTKQALDKL